MKISVDFGGAQTGVTYDFVDGTGVVGAPSVVGVTQIGATGAYFAEVTPPAGAWAVLWECDEVGLYAIRELNSGYTSDLDAYDGYTFVEAMKIILATLAGKTSGMATNAPIFRAVDDSKARVIGTLDSGGNRTAVTIDAA